MLQLIKREEYFILVTVAFAGRIRTINLFSLMCKKTFKCKHKHKHKHKLQMLSMRHIAFLQNIIAKSFSEFLNHSHPTLQLDLTYLCHSINSCLAITGYKVHTHVSPSSALPNVDGSSVGLLKLRTTCTLPY